MRVSIDRRGFGRQAGTAAATVMGAPLLIPAGVSTQGERLVVAVGQWGG